MGSNITQMKRVLCLGDSLTEGLVTSNKYEFYPYTNCLQEMLGNEYEVVNKGYSGDRTDQIMNSLIELIKCTGFDYQFAIILGGTNDLCQTDGEEIIKNLQFIAERCIQKGAITFLLSIPEMQFDGTLFEEEKRQSVNSSLENFANNTKNCYYIDFGAKIINDPKSSKYNKDYWSDNIHFSELGYKLMGEIIYEELSKHLH